MTTTTNNCGGCVYKSVA